MTNQDTPRNDLALAEAALFLAVKPLTRRALANILGGVAQAYVDQLWEDLKTRFDDPSRGIELHIEHGRAMFRVKAAYVNQVAHLAPQQDVAKPVLRTLAVIAYNHPMTQADLIKVRGNKGYGHVQELIERDLIATEEHGRTLLLSVTKDFLRHFGLKNVEEFRFHFPASPEQDPAAVNIESSSHQADVNDVDEVTATADGPDSENEHPEQTPPETAEETASDEVSDGDAPQCNDPANDDLEVSSTETPDDSQSKKASAIHEPAAFDVGTAEPQDNANQQPVEEVEDG